jgi:hypothetical protein
MLMSKTFSAFTRKCRGLSRQDLILALASVIVVLYALSCWVPWQPIYVHEIGLDPSYRIALHELFVAGKNFGHDISFVLGPWGILFTDYYYPSTYWLLLLAWGFFTCLFLWVARLTYRHFITSPLVMALWLCAIIAVLGTGEILSSSSFGFQVTMFKATRDPFFICLNSLLLISYFYGEGHRESKFKEYSTSLPLLLLTAGIAWASLIKFSFFTIAASTIFIITLDELLRQRRFPRFLLTYALGMVMFWLLARQPLLSLWPFLLNSYRVADGYTEAMSSQKMLVFGGDITFFRIGALLLIGLVFWLERRRGAWGMLPLAGLGLVVFCVAKSGFARHDGGHAAQAALTLIALALLYGPILLKALPERPLPRAVPLLYGLLLGTAVAAAASTFSPIGLVKATLMTVRLFVPRVQAVTRLATGTAHLDDHYEAALASIRRDYPLPKITDDVDFYPDSQSIVIAHHLSYNPRPMFQSCTAYTPELSRQNAEHLTGAEAPHSVLFDVSTIDDRLPALDDGLSWPELLTRYEIKGTTKSSLLLKKSREKRTFNLSTLEDTTVPWNAPISIPALQDGPIWARIDMRPTALGRLTLSLYKLPVLHINVKMKNGGTQTFRFLPGMARAGFLLSPLIQNKKEFAELASTHWKQGLLKNSVEMVSISAEPQDAPQLFYRRECRLTLSTLNFPHQELALNLGAIN